MAFDLSDYTPVHDRITAFWEQHPEGRILTEVISADEKHALVSAAVFTDGGDPRPRATGVAHEVAGGSPVNRTSWVENAETSAIGRALANLGFASHGERPSREEMESASNAPADEVTRKRIIAVARGSNVTQERAQEILQEVAGVSSTAELPMSQAEEVIARLKAEFDATDA